MLDAFKIKPFELEPIFATWSDGPRFVGNPKKDLPVDEWLKQIKDGCVQRNIPEEYWYKVAQHFMGPKAKARFDEVKAVVAKVHGGKYRWTWKKYKIAMQNMGWGIDTTATETIKVQGKPSSLWWIPRKKEGGEIADEEAHRPAPVRSNSTFWTSGKAKDDTEVVETNTHRTRPSRSNSFWVSSKPSKDEPEEISRPVPTRSGTDIFWPVRRGSKDPDTDENPQRPSPQTVKSDSAVLTARGTPKPPTPTRSNTGEGAITTVTHAPVWLLNACTALDFITSEHPKAMSVLSAILITAGSLPAIPAISAGAGGAVLASGAAHAIGAIAVGLGQVLSTSVKNQQQENQAASTVR